MIKHIWSVLCQKSVVDSESNNVSLFDVLEQLQIDIASNIPNNVSNSKNIILPIQYELINFWSKTGNGEEKADVKIILKDTTGKEVKKIEKVLTIPEKNRRMREINKIQGLPISGNGNYKFIVSIKNSNDDNYKDVAEIPLEVIVSKDN